MVNKGHESPSRQVWTAGAKTSKRVVGDAHRPYVVGEPDRTRHTSPRRTGSGDPTPVGVGEGVRRVLLSLDFHFLETSHPGPVVPASLSSNPWTFSLGLGVCVWEVGRGSEGVFCLRPPEILSSPGVFNFTSYLLTQNLITLEKCPLPTVPIKN